MNIKTKYHGEMVINEKEILTFENGIPGFLDEKQFILLPLTDDRVYFVLQSVQTEELTFVVTDPFLFFPDYDFNLEDTVVSQLHIEAPTDVKVMNILTLQDPFEKTTVNLQAPIVINTKNNEAKQVILNNEAYKTKHPLFKKSPASVKG
ncbi:flagellar assembly protein FliW [Bacillus andreraoultii]|uniref:flagellar assembly protein FliW n=1 Tax=Bacillus andreraoultii TaxID=1499685 RepID=UPI000A45FACD|nr:flagellar assembly protein FliW [Bacillus andreraoultii]